ncbi:MAG: tetratricopeptide repeat protein, partial [Flavitalea sp.]
PIGSNSSEGNNALSVSTKESENFIRRALTTPPSRNEAFIWQIKTYLHRDLMPEAASLIQTLKNDPNFPERLNNDINEVQALYFYKQENYDSAAYYLTNALDNAANRLETSRWEYLIAQLYERADKKDLAQEFYDRAMKHTLDPVLEVYSRLNSIRQNTSDSIAIKKNIEDLTKMGRRDRYTKYRDIIYYTAAQIELERKNIPGAKAMLLKSASAASENLNNTQRTKSFLMLGDLSYDEQLFPEAKNFYDSISTSDMGITDPVKLEKRKEVLGLIVTQLDIIHRQDSLMALAAMPEAERNAVLKKMVRQLRKKQGLKEEETGANTAVGLNNNTKGPPPDLFENNNSRGDWYFANPSLKSKGFSSFKSVWGNRPNVDNWRRQSAVSEASVAAKELKTSEGAAKAGEQESSEISVASLLKNIPLSSEQVQASDDSVGNSLLELGIVYVNGLEEYPGAIVNLEKFTEKYAYNSRMPEALYYLYYCYMKTGAEAKATAALNQLNQKYGGSKFEKQLNNSLTGEDSKAKAELTGKYERIYNLFIEGSFEEALKLKKLTDSAYGANYWTPNLLYIESVYFLKQRMDTEARTELQKIIELYPDAPLAARSKTILEVLGRRKEIEDYLTKLKIDTNEMKVDVPDTRVMVTRASLPRDTLFRQKPILPKAGDSSIIKKPVSAAQARKDSLAGKVPELVSAFTYAPEIKHFVAILLNKVDPVYVTESRNAFNRFNQEKYYNKPIEINNLPLNDTLKLVVMSGFENAAAALEYVEKTKPVAATRIIPWLPAGKYSFLIISEPNLEILKQRQDMNAYRKFLSQYYPGQF